LFLQEPTMILGRTGQVSILNPDINGGNLPGTLLRQIGLALGMFLWRGDMILRHNPAGRPVFDWLMAVPFLLGLVWCLVNWKRPSALLVLLWVSVMLWPTILAEDTPHFLRAVGVLPAALLLPALGLAWLWDWARLPVWLRQGVVLVLVVGSLWLTVQDYVNYARQPDVAYLFETAVTDLAESINQDSAETATSTGSGQVVYLDEERFWQKYSTLRYLVPEERVTLYRPENGLDVDINQGIAVYTYPFIAQDFVESMWQSPALVSVEVGSLARGDLETEAVPLYLRYGVESAPDLPMMASFSDQMGLYDVVVVETEDGRLLVDLVWMAETATSASSSQAVLDDLVVFVHVVGADGLVAQDDSPPANGFWPADWWQPGLFLRDRHEIVLPENTDAAAYQFHIGWYDAATQTRLPVRAEDGTPLGDAFIWSNHRASE
ncbi:MAG: hypothetical protein IAF02_20480, partial [Anaerolineae bacterium]|nr:hypothetical protein [Anaerolineae bacterium]